MFNSVTDYGAVGDGVADDLPAFIAALAANETVLVPKPSVAYRITDKIAVGSGKRLLASDGRPPFRLDSISTGTFFDLDWASDTEIAGFEIDGTATIPGDGFSMRDSVNCHVHDMVVHDCTDPGASGMGCVLLDGNPVLNRVSDFTIYNCVGSGVGISGFGASRNTVENIKVFNLTKFGVRLGEGANKNLVTGCSTAGNGIELVGVTSPCEFNRIIANHAEGCGDNGISISGSHNVVVGNVCKGNQYSGIGIWGSYNTVTGNNCLDNHQTTVASSYAGIEVRTGYGGLGQGNIITGNVLDDTQPVPTQRYGVRLNAGTAGNMVGPNICTRYATAPYFDAGDWAANVLIRSDGNRISLGAPSPAYTGLGQLSVGTGVGNNGVIIQSGASSLSRYAFGDSAMAGYIEFNHATDTMGLAAGGIHMVRLNSSKLGFFGALASKPTGIPITAAGVHAALVSLGLIS